MNNLYRLSNLLDGSYDLDQNKLYYNPIRHYFNRFIQIFAYFISLNHMVIFISDDATLKHELVSFRISEGIGERIANITVGASIFFFGWIVGIYQEFHKYPEKLKVFNFLFCFDQNEMQERFKLEKNLAKKQVKLQRLFRTIANFWHKLYFTTLCK